MANKNHSKKKYETDDFDIDSDLNIPDFEFDVEDVSKDRNPVVTAAKSALKGAVDSMTNVGVIRSTIKKSLPKEYGNVLDLTDHASGSIRSLYDTAVHEFKPVSRDLKRISGKVAPAVEGVLGKKIADRLRKYSKTDGTVGVDLSAERQRDDTLIMELGNIFKLQAEDADKKGISDQNREQLKESIEQVRYRDQISQLDSIRVGIEQLTSYQDNVLSNYQRKSLELQFRQYFVTADLLETTKKAAADQDTRLQGILKNTGLPEFVKINESERFSEIARNKFYTDIRDSLFGDFDSTEYIKKFVDNIKKTLTTKVKEWTDTANQATFAVDMATDSIGSGEGPSKAQIVGGVAGGMVGDHLVEKGQDWLKKRLENNPELAKGAKNLSYRVNNFAQLVDDHMSDSNWGQFEGLREFLNENRPQTIADTNLDVDALSEMHKPIPFNRSANKSIIEIIPGYLARIHREIQVLRTGDETIGLSTYDYTANKFTTQKELSKKIVRELITKGTGYGSDNVADLKERQAKFLKIVDPENKFTEVQKNAINETLLNTSIRKKSTDAKHLTDKFYWRKAGDQAGDIAKAFSKLLETDEEGRRANTLSAITNQNLISDSIRGLTKNIEDPRARVQEMVNTGQYDVLRTAGLIDEDNRVSISNLVKLLSGKEVETSEPIVEKNKTVKSSNVDINRKVKVKGPVKSEKDPLTFNKTISRVEAVAHIDPSTFDPLAKAIYSLQDTFQAPPTLKPMETLVELVTSIEKRLSLGLIVWGDTTGRILNGIQSGAEWASQKASVVKKKWSEVSIGELSSKAIDLGKKGLSYAKDKASKLTNIAAGLAFKARDVIQSTVQRAVDKFGDVYVGSELAPRLTRAKMLAGEYYDQTTGKVLTSLEDIKGVVVDKDGNIILSIDDLKIAQLRGKVTEYLKDKVQGLSSIIAKAAMYSGGVIGGLYGKMLVLGVAGIKAAKKFLPPFDVYVNGDMDKPLLYATQFRLGTYFSKKTGLVIKHPRDIDGPVLDKDGNIIVTDEQIGRGLVDRNGIAVSNILGRGLNKIKELGLAGFSLIKKFGMSAKNFAMGALSSIGEIVKGLFNGFSYFGEKYVEINKDQLDVQLEILKLLQERLPKKVVGDVNGDGVREGSIEDIIKRRQEEKSKKQEDLSEKAKVTPGGGSSIYGALAGLLKGKKKEESEEKGSSLLSDAADAADIYDSVKGNKGGVSGKDVGTAASKAGKAIPKATTKLGRLAQGAKGLLGKAGSVVGKTAGMALGAASTFFGLGGTLGAVGGLLGKAATASASTIGSAGMGLGRLALGALTSGSTIAVARTALMGLTGALFSPIGLAALGLTAAYYGYKYLTRKKLEVLNKVRYVQYGFNANDEDHFKAVFELEDKLEDNVKLDGATAKLDEKKVDLNELSQPFGVKAEDKESVRKWVYWFNERFKPIFLAHKSALQAIKPDIKISDVDGSKLTSEEKLKYLGATELPGANYDLQTSPFKDLERLISDAQAVQAQIEIARTILEKEVKNNSKNKTTTIATVTAVTGSVNDKNSNAKSTVSKSANVLGLSSLLGNLNKPETVKDSVNNVSAQSNVSADYLFTGDKGQMDALTVIRFKTYGLMEMDAEKVKALRYLEVYVARNTKFSNDKAEYSQDIETLLEDVRAYFGISGARSPRGYKWITWFRARFLPVFLNFLTAVQKATGKTDIVQAERSLTPEKAVAVASTIYTTVSTYNSRSITVWKITDCSPWDNYPLNDNERSIDLNLEALKEATKAVIRGEHKSDKVRQVTADNRNLAIMEGTTPDNKTRSELGGGAFVGFSKPASLTEKQLGETSVFGNNKPEFMRPDGQNIRAVGEYMTGVKIKHPGAGTGGDINSLPDPGSAAGVDAIVPLLLAVAKMTGVDPKILIDICAIESKFDPQARPFNPRTGSYLSSAAGLFQFLKGTWNDQLRANGAKYGIALGTPPTDARANALMGAEFIKSNMKYLNGKVKRDLTETDVYLAHFLGADGAAKFLQLDSNAKAASIMQDEARANPGVFYNREGKERTAKEIYDHFTKTLTTRARELGVSDSMIVEEKMPSAKDGKMLNQSTSSATSTLETGNSSKQTDKSTAMVPGAFSTVSPIKTISDTVTSNVQNTGTSSNLKKTVAVDAMKTVAEMPAKTSASITNPSIVDNLQKSVESNSLTKTIIDDRVPVEMPSPPTQPIVRKPLGFTGFQPQTRPNQQEIQAMDIANRQGIEKGINDVGKTLLRSLGVHEESRDLLRKIVDAISVKSTSTEDKVQTPSSSTSSQAILRPPTEAPRAPVGMKRSQ